MHSLEITSCKQVLRLPWTKSSPTNPWNRPQTSQQTRSLVTQPPPRMIKRVWRIMTALRISEAKTGTTPRVPSSRPRTRSTPLALPILRGDWLGRRDHMVKASIKMTWKRTVSLEERLLTTRIRKWRGKLRKNSKNDTTHPFLRQACHFWFRWPDI